MSDLVFCRTWVPVEPARYYNPVCSLLEAAPAAGGKKEGGEEGEDGVTAAPWQGMRTTAEMRRARQIPIPVIKDSLYKPIERETRRFNKLVIPQALQVGLPAGRLGVGRGTCFVAVAFVTD